MQACRLVRRPFRTSVSKFVLLLLCAGHTMAQSDAMQPDSGQIGFEHIAAMRRVTSVAISPDGRTVACVVSVPRRPGVDEDGPAWAELHVATDGSPARAFVHGEVNVSKPQFDAAGEHILYLAARNGDEESALWSIPVTGGESFKALEHATSISAFAVSRTGNRVAYIATEKDSEERKNNKEKGFTQEILGEDASSARVWVSDLPPLSPAPTQPRSADETTVEPTSLAIEGSVSRLAWTPAGDALVVAVAPTPAVDDSYMFNRLRHVDATSGDTVAAFDNPGKLGAFAISPDGRHLALISAQDFNDPKEGRLLVAPAEGGPFRDLLPGLEGHVSQIVWRDAETLVYVADIGTGTEVATVRIDGSRQPITATDNTLVVTGLVAGGNALAFIGERPSHPPEAFRWITGKDPDRLSESNPWLASISLAEQEVVTWTARDGVTLEGILMHPLEPSEGPAPLIMIVHGGPEGHVRNGWNTSYARPGQLAAAKGYAVFYPNYRGSTGRGVAFSKLGQGDAGGPEFDDLIDGIDHLIKSGIADRERVGITGGSYGGYATAWCATRYSERFRAGVMFNGISNKHSKALTTDIPKEDRAVHTLYDPWTRAGFALERSPLTFVEQSRTPLLIMGGAADTRVHPSQSLQLWNALRMQGKAPVRLVRYLGEPHGNRRAASRDDYVRRLMRWMNHFVLEDGKEAPPWELER